MWLQLQPHLSPMFSCDLVGHVMSPQLGRVKTKDEFCVSVKQQGDSHISNMIPLEGQMT